LEKDVAFFAAERKIQRSIQLRATVNDKLLEASYLVRKRTAKSGGTHTTVENVIMLCIVLNESSVKEYQEWSSSNNMAGCSTDDITNIKPVSCSQLQSCDFSCQHDE
jgi:hypothetical protein